MVSVIADKPRLVASVLSAAARTVNRGASVSPMMFPRDPDGPDLAGEHRALSAWGDTLEARHAALMAITDQLNLWVQDADAGSAAVSSEAVPNETVLDDAYEVLWGAYEAEQASLDEAFLLLDLGFEVLAQAAAASGIDLDELDDEPGWA